MFLKLFSLCFLCISANTEYSPLKSMKKEFPLADTITLTEGDPLWEQKHSALYTEPDLSDIYTTSSHPFIFGEDKDAAFSALSLKQFLEAYAAKVKKEKMEYKMKDQYIHNSDYIENTGKKNVSLFNYNKPFTSPNKDKNGWVSLEPVPWSVSQISKWQNKPKPIDEYATNQYLDKNNWDNLDKSQIINIAEMNVPSFIKKKPQISNKIKLEFNSELEPIKEKYQRPHVISDINHGVLKDYKDIITDGSTPNFPLNQIEANRRQSASDPHYFTGNGNWVLLSTSKGYKYPKKQRSIKLNPDYVDAHKVVHLTVLPPLNNSNINMTTSHGGLLQVESTFEPVEESHKNLQKLQKLKNKRRRPNNLKKRRKIQRLKAIQKSAPRSTNDSGAVLAGVGAGLIPATMAMMVPLVMNGKKRKKRHM